MSVDVSIAHLIDHMSSLFCLTTNIESGLTEWNRHTCLLRSASLLPFFDCLSESMNVWCTQKSKIYSRI